MRGEEHGMSVLTAEIVLKMRARYFRGNCSYAKVAAEFQCAINTARRAILGITWKHVIYPKSDA